LTVCSSRSSARAHWPPPWTWRGRSGQCLHKKGDQIHHVCWCLLNRNRNPHVTLYKLGLRRQCSRSFPDRHPCCESVGSLCRYWLAHSAHWCILVPCATVARWRTIFSEVQKVWVGPWAKTDPKLNKLTAPSCPEPDLDFHCFYLFLRLALLRRWRCFCLSSAQSKAVSKGSSDLWSGCIRLHPAACGIWVLGLLGFLDIAGILMSPLQWPASCNSAHMRSYALPNESKWPRGRYLVNAYQTGFGLVVCVLEAHRVKGVGCTATRFRHVRLHQSGLEATPDWRRHDARCTMYDGCIDLSPLCKLQCTLQYCIFRDIQSILHIQGFNMVQSLQPLESLQSSYFIFHLQSFAIPFRPSASSTNLPSSWRPLAGRGGSRGLDTRDRYGLHGRWHMDANLQ